MRHVGTVRIKEGIDLKELEKFGFELEDDYYVRRGCDGRANTLEYRIHKTSYTRELKIRVRMICAYVDKTIYELTKADMLEIREL